MYKISKEFSFSAAHCLNEMPDGHPCSKNHGHNYTVIVELASTTLNKNGMVLDYHEFAPIKNFLDKELDHQFLNDKMSFHPTAENLAYYLFNVIWLIKPFNKYLNAITIKETDKTFARYEK